MTREDIIGCITDDVHFRSCPTYSCSKPEDEGNTGDCCRVCAEEQLTEYDKSIKKDMFNQINSIVNSTFLNDTMKVLALKRWLKENRQ